MMVWARVMLAVAELMTAVVRLVRRKKQAPYGLESQAPQTQAKTAGDVIAVKGGHVRIVTNGGPSTPDEPPAKLPENPY